MKHFIIVFIISILPWISASAQDISNDVKKNWYYYTNSFLSDLETEHAWGSMLNYYISGTTTKKGKNYQMLWQEERLDIDSNEAKSYMHKVPFKNGVESATPLLIRSEDGKVYADAESFYELQQWFFFEGPKNGCPYEETADGEIILYDYTKNIGDVYRLKEGYGNITVSKVETITYGSDNLAKKKLTLSNGAVIVEGLGCVFRGFLLNYLDEITDFKYLSYCQEKDPEKELWNKLRNEAQADYGRDFLHRPLLKEGKTWNYVYHHFEETFDGSHNFTHEALPLKYVLEDKITIDGHECYRLYKYFNGGDAVYVSTWYEDEDRKVYTIDEDTKETRLMFDMGMERGAVYSGEISETFGDIILKNIELEKNNDNYFPVYIIADDELEYSWIDGVGSITDGILDNWLLPILPCICDYTSFASCEEDGKVIWETSIETGVEPIEKTASSTSDNLYDLSGRRLTKEPQRGVYIKDGRKVVIK